MRGSERRSAAPAGVRLAVRLGGTALLAATLAGCWWPAPGAGPDRRAHNRAEDDITAETVGSLHQIWSAPTDASAGDPVTSGTGVHVDGMRATYAYRTDGTMRWKVEIPPQHAPFAEFTSLVVDGDRVLAVRKAFDGYTGAAEATAGTWFDTGTGAETGAGPVADSVRGELAAGSRTDYLDGVYGETLQIADAATGQVLDGGLLSLWFIDITRPAPTHVTLGTEAVFQSGPGLPADHQGIADLGVRSFPRRGGARNCGPQPAPLFACPAWVTDLAGVNATPVTVSADQETLYLGVDDALYALDAGTGAVLWTAGLPAAATDAPAVADGWVFVPMSGDHLVALAAGGCGGPSCSPAWLGAVGSAVNVQPAVAGTGADAIVIVGGVDGGLDAFPVAGCGAGVCPPTWSGSAGSPVTGAPAVSNGRVYVGTAAGLVAFGL
jgi:outer membrane protein assembly factor BamB